MRIVAGKHRGRRLQALPGADIRPTADRVREALFNILSHAPWARESGGVAGVAVADLFAGTGALGLEALSRGARHVTFVDVDPAACRLIERNARSLDEGDRVTVLRGDATRLVIAPLAHQLVFLDPPYRGGLAVPALESLAAAGWLAPGALAVVELAKADKLAPPAGFELLDERRYGATRVLFLDFTA